jgi:hypothetical protein
MRSTLKLTAFATLTALALSTTGCNGGDVGRQEQPTPAPAPAPDPGPPTTGPDGNPLPGPTQPAPAPVASYSGVYEVVAPLDFTQNNVLPGIISPLLGGLSELHDHPGDALYTILEGSNIPYISDLMMKVPDFLKAGLTAMLDNLIINNVYQGYPVVDQITGIVQGIAEVSKYMEVHDTITLHKPASDGSLMVDQQLDAIGFRLFGTTQVVPLPAASLPQALAHMRGQLTAHNDAPVADADLTIEAGTYSLPVGSLMLEALGPLLFSQFGGAMDLAGALKNLVPCADFGQLLVDNSGGLLTDPTIGQGLCEGALDIAAKAVTQQIATVTLDGIVVDGTSAQLFDVSMKSPKMDYQSDRLAQGTWTWHFDVSGGMAAVPSTFAGDRTGTAN